MNYSVLPASCARVLLSINGLVDLIAPRLLYAGSAVGWQPDIFGVAILRMLMLFSWCVGSRYVEHPVHLNRCIYATIQRPVLRFAP